MKIKPLHDHILIERIQEEVKKGIGKAVETVITGLKKISAEVKCAAYLGPCLYWEIIDSL